MSRDVGEETFTFAVISVPDDWELPILQSS
jgi:hypothetical protein